MWIYTEYGKLVNLDHCAHVEQFTTSVSAFMGGSANIILSGNPDDIDRIYTAMNAGVAVLDLRGEQHG